MQDSIFLKALRGENFEGRPPIWLMRQAGRSLPSFRQIRKEHSFHRCMTSPEIATQITLLPEKELGVDALVLFSDILAIYEAFQMEVRFPRDGRSPFAEGHFEEKETVEKSLWFVAETIQKIKTLSTLPLIGFAGAPFTVLTYFLEGGIDHSRFEKTRAWMREKPKEIHRLLRLLTNKTIEYLKMQVSAGIDAFQLFDSWAGLFTLDELMEFSFPYAEEILSACHIPTLFFTRKSGLYAREIRDCIRPSGISIDWEKPLVSIRSVLGIDVALQGNLNPEILLQPIERIKEHATFLLESMKGDPAFIFNLGHGVLPTTPVEHVRWLTQFVTSWHEEASNKELLQGSLQN